MEYEAKRNDSTCLAVLEDGMFAVTRDGQACRPNTNDFEAATLCASINGIAFDALYVAKTDSWIQLSAFVKAAKNPNKAIEKCLMYQVNWD